MKTPTKTIKNIDQEYKVTPVRKRANLPNQTSQHTRPEESTPVLGEPLTSSTSKPTHKKATGVQEKPSRSTTKKVSFMQYSKLEDQEEDHHYPAHRNGSEIASASHRQSSQIKKEFVLEEIDQNRQSGKHNHQKSNQATEGKDEQAKVASKQRGAEQSLYSSSIKTQKAKRVQQKDSLSDVGKKERMVKALKHLCEDVEFDA